MNRMVNFKNAQQRQPSAENSRAKRQKSKEAMRWLTIFQTPPIAAA
jgi:hypothetical protein